MNAARACVDHAAQRGNELYTGGNGKLQMRQARAASGEEWDKQYKQREPQPRWPRKLRWTDSENGGAR